jgi:hypothetical protein
LTTILISRIRGPDKTTVPTTADVPEASRGDRLRVIKTQAAGLSAASKLFKQLESIMPLKLNVGLSKKIGQPDYGSLGASCHLELELDQSLVFDDLDGLHERIKNVFAACRQAVTDELASSAARHINGNSQTTTAGQANDSANGHRVTQKQLEYAQQLAAQIRGLGIRRLDGLAQLMFSKPLADSSSLEASGLIDVLKDIKAGKVDLAAVINGL